MTDENIKTIDMNNFKARIVAFDYLPQQVVYDHFDLTMLCNVYVHHYVNARSIDKEVNIDMCSYRSVIINDLHLF
jgi:hypothetical protein